MNRSLGFVPFSLLAVVACAVVLLGPAATSGAEPEWTNTGLRDAISSVAVGPGGDGMVYANGKQGLWTSYDGGVTWALAGSSPQGTIVPDPADPATLYVHSVTYGRQGMEGGGIFKSVDSGTSWLPILPDKPVPAFAIDPARPNVAYAGVVYTTTKQVQILRSADAGLSWEPAIDPWTDPRGMYVVMKDIVVDPATDTVYAAFGAEDQTVYYNNVMLRSGDGGLTWATVGLPRGHGLLARIRPGSGGASASRLFAVFSKIGRPPIIPGLLTSDDGGATWQDLTDKLPARIPTVSNPPFIVTHDGIAIISLDCGPRSGPRACLYVYGDSGVSGDSGASWSPLPPFAGEASELAWSPGFRTLFAAGGEGVWRYPLDARVAAAPTGTARSAAGGLVE